MDTITGTLVRVPPDPVWAPGDSDIGSASEGFKPLLSHNNSLHERFRDG
jgi:hypothetical protein